METANIYLIADTHFNDPNIISFEGRGFKNIEEMNEMMISNWNSVISPSNTDSDTSNTQVIVAGDFIIGGDNAKDIIQSLNGDISLIMGNHDQNVEEYRSLIRNVYEYPIVVDDFWIISHFPMYVSMQSPYANIFGHIHSNPAFKSVSARSMCISSERLNYKPIALSQVKAAIHNESLCSSDWTTEL